MRPAEGGHAVTITVQERLGATPGRTLAFLVEERMLTQSVGYPNRDGTMEGPDIMFVPLPRQLMEKIEDRAGAVFHNIELDLQRLDKAFHGQMVMFQTVGHARSDGQKAEAKIPDPDNTTQVIPRIVQVRRSENESCEDRNGWDYIRLECLTDVHQGSTVIELSENAPTVVRELSLREPQSWGGMSGGGVWWTADNGQGQRSAGLSGLMFYEYAQNGRLKLYAHGKASLKRILDEAQRAGIDYQPSLARVHWR